MLLRDFHSCAWTSRLLSSKIDHSDKEVFSSSIPPLLMS